MRVTGRYIEENYNKTQLIYTFANGSYIEFFSADQEDKVRGPRRHVLYINECNNLSYDTYHQLAIRTAKTIWLDFNPSNEFWAYTECKEDEDTEWLTLTYKDNEGLPDAIKREIEKARDKAFFDPEGNIHDEKNTKNKFWKNWWLVYGLGLLGSLDGVIFGNWDIIPEIPEGAVFVGSGNDFGYTNDPTTVVDVYIYGAKRILDERCYSTGLLNSDIAAILKQGNPPPIVYSDSAEPKSIAEIKKAGVNIHAVHKGKDSINYGIQIMQQQDYLVTARSINLIKELRQYCWDVDSNGNKLNKPAGGFDHCFVGETHVTTLKGEKRIDELSIGDFILTSKGYKPLMKKWDNGLKQIETYSLVFDTLIVYLSCTPDHKVKTQKGWIKISQLKSGAEVFLNKPTTDYASRYTLKKGIFPEAIGKCIKLYGKRKMGKKHLKDFTYTTLMKILGTTNQKTSPSKNLLNTYANTCKKDTQRIRSGRKHSTQKESRQLKNGTQVKKACLGIKSMPKDSILVNGTYQKRNATFVRKYLSRRHTTQDSVEITAKANGVEILVSTMLPESATYAVKSLQSISTYPQKNVVNHTEKVYDIMVSDTHEYFANGVLVHNCIDAVRYHEMMAIGKKKRKAVFGWKTPKEEEITQVVYVKEKEVELENIYNVDDLI